MFDAHTPVEKLLAALDALVTQGKLRHFGVSNYPGWPLMKALEVTYQGDAVTVLEGSFW